MNNGPSLIGALKSKERHKSGRRELSRYEYLLTLGIVENHMYYIKEEGV